MCGIAGYVGAGQDPAIEFAVRRMMERLRRRGPDSEGLHAWPDAVFGHRRLAILDLSPAGHQPMLTPDGELGVVFNGCIYNFLELRAELEARGVVFQSHCDTEVLLHGYRAWGGEGLARRLRGMYAFALWDAREQRLTLVRDRLGVKPLYYAEPGNGTLVFASSAVALRQGLEPGGICDEAVLAFLEFGYVPEHLTIYRGQCKLAPGTLLEWHKGRSRLVSYWELPARTSSSGPGFEEAVEQTQTLILDAVRLRLQSDVPVGALLSGGIDSTLVCWAMARLNANIRAFTVSAAGDPSDESAAAAQTARQLGLHHEIVPLPEQTAGLLEELIEAYGEPFACSSALAMLRVSRAVRPYATVLLTGDGGDDIFLGYPYHANYWRAQKLAQQIPAPLASLWPLGRGLTAPFSFLRRPRHFLDYATGGLGAVTRVHDGLPYFEGHGLLGDRLAPLTLPERQIPLSPASGRQLLDDMLAYERRMQLPGEFLTKVDGATTHHSLEARSPLLDTVLWDYAATLPFSTRLQNGQLKAVLKEIVRRHLGPEVADRPKQGFTVPVERWLATQWREPLEELLSGGTRLEALGLVRPGKMAPALASELRQGRVPVQWWYLLVLNRWLDASALQ